MGVKGESGRLKEKRKAGMRLAEVTATENGSGPRSSSSDLGQRGQKFFNSRIHGCRFFQAG